MIFKWSNQRISDVEKVFRRYNFKGEIKLSNSWAMHCDGVNQSILALTIETNNSTVKTIGWVTLDFNLIQFYSFEFRRPIL
ncbi:unnamed protein product [Amaranthus hypochondriacus]